MPNIRETFGIKHLNKTSVKSKKENKNRRKTEPSRPGSKKEMMMQKDLENAYRQRQKINFGIGTRRGKYDAEAIENENLRQRSTVILQNNAPFISGDRDKQKWERSVAQVERYIEQRDIFSEKIEKAQKAKVQYVEGLAKRMANRAAKEKGKAGYRYQEDQGSQWYDKGEAGGLEQPLQDDYLDIQGGYSDGVGDEDLPHARAGVTIEDVGEDESEDEYFDKKQKHSRKVHGSKSDVLGAFGGLLASAGLSVAHGAPVWAGKDVVGVPDNVAKENDDNKDVETSLDGLADEYVKKSGYNGPHINIMVLFLGQDKEFIEDALKKALMSQLNIEKVGQNVRGYRERVELALSDDVCKILEHELKQHVKNPKNGSIGDYLTLFLEHGGHILSYKRAKNQVLEKAKEHFKGNSKWKEYFDSFDQGIKDLETQRHLYAFASDHMKVLFLAANGDNDINQKMEADAVVMGSPSNDVMDATEEGRLCGIASYPDGVPIKSGNTLPDDFLGLVQTFYETAKSLITRQKVGADEGEYIIRNRGVAGGFMDTGICQVKGNNKKMLDIIYRQGELNDYLKKQTINVYPNPSSAEGGMYGQERNVYDVMFKTPAKETKEGHGFVLGGEVNNVFSPLSGRHGGSDSKLMSSRRLGERTVYFLTELCQMPGLIGAYVWMSDARDVNTYVADIEKLGVGFINSKSCSKKSGQWGCWGRDKSDIKATYMPMIDFSHPEEVQFVLERMGMGDVARFGLQGVLGISHFKSDAEKGLMDIFGKLLGYKSEGNHLMKDLEEFFLSRPKAKKDFGSLIKKFNEDIEELMSEGESLPATEWAQMFILKQAEFVKRSKDLLSDSFVKNLEDGSLEVEKLGASEQGKLIEMPLKYLLAEKQKEDGKTIKKRLNDKSTPRKAIDAKNTTTNYPKGESKNSAIEIDADLLKEIVQKGGEIPKKEGDVIVHVVLVIKKEDGPQYAEKTVLRVIKNKIALEQKNKGENIKFKIICDTETLSVLQDENFKYAKLLSESGIEVLDVGTMEGQLVQNLIDKKGLSQKEAEATARDAIEFHRFCKRMHIVNSFAGDSMRLIAANAEKPGATVVKHESDAELFTTPSQRVREGAENSSITIVRQAYWHPAEMAHAEFADYGEFVVNVNKESLEAVTRTARFMQGLRTFRLDTYTREDWDNGEKWVSAAGKKIEGVKNISEDGKYTLQEILEMPLDKNGNTPLMPDPKQIQTFYRTYLNDGRGEWLADQVYTKAPFDFSPRTKGGWVSLIVWVGDKGMDRTSRNESLSEMGSMSLEVGGVNGVKIDMPGLPNANEMLSARFSVGGFGKELHVNPPTNAKLYMIDGGYCEKISSNVHDCPPKSREEAIDWAIKIYGDGEAGKAREMFENHFMGGIKSDGTIEFSATKELYDYMRTSSMVEEVLIRTGNDTTYAELEETLTPLIDLQRETWLKYRLAVLRQEKAYHDMYKKGEPFNISQHMDDNLAEAMGDYLVKELKLYPSISEGQNVKPILLTKGSGTKSFIPKVQRGDNLHKDGNVDIYTPRMPYISSTLYQGFKGTNAQIPRPSMQNANPLQLTTQSVSRVAFDEGAVSSIKTGDLVAMGAVGLTGLAVAGYMYSRLTKMGRKKDKSKLAINKHVVRSGNVPQKWAQKKRKNSDDELPVKGGIIHV